MRPWRTKRQLNGVRRACEDQMRRFDRNTEQACSTGVQGNRCILGTIDCACRATRTGICSPRTFHSAGRDLRALPSARHFWASRSQSHWRSRSALANTAVGCWLHLCTARVLSALLPTQLLVVEASPSPHPQWLSSKGFSRWCQLTPPTSCCQILTSESSSCGPLCWCEPLDRNLVLAGCRKILGHFQLNLLC